MLSTPNPAPLKKHLKAHPWRWGILALVGLLLLGGIGFSLRQTAQKTQQPAHQTALVEHGAIESRVMATGQVHPNFEVEIKGKGSGMITHLPYDVSDFVPKGALLVELDPIDENRQVHQAQASLAGMHSRLVQSRLSLEAARKTLETDLMRAKADLRAAELRQTEAANKRKRLETLVQKRFISQEEYEAGLTTDGQADADLQNARIRLQELQNQEIALQAQSQDLHITGSEARAQRVVLATAQQRLTETKIYAPISGVVTSRAGQIGQIVASGISNVGGGTAIMTLADLSRIFVLAAVDESDIGRVSPGQRVEITADAFPGEVFQGNVLRISPKGLEESNVVTFEVKIEVTGPNKDLLKPTMTANVEIITAQRKNALLVPSDAITQENGQSQVLVVQGDRPPQARTVRTGLSNGHQTEIVDGLRAGEQVVIQAAQQASSRWKKDAPPSSTQRGQRAMMRSLGSGGGRR